MMSGATEGGAGQYPVFDKAPLYLRLTLIFPYTKGMLFQNAVFDRDGTERIRRGLPASRRSRRSRSSIRRSTLAASSPLNPNFPSHDLPKGYKSLVGGSLGELEHTIMLEQYSGKERAAEIAPHWRGCAFELLENKKDGRIVLLYAAEWDSEDAARQYFAAYRRQLSQKWKHDGGRHRNRRRRHRHR